jgi:hypothetical protein
LLLKAALLAPPRQAAQDIPVPKKPESAGPATRELEALARDMARSKRYSYEQAFSALYTDPERAELVQRVKREEAEQRRAVVAQRFPMRDAELESRTDAWRRGDGRVG